MPRILPAAARAKELLYGASRQLQTANPVEQLGDVLDASLYRPLGDAAYRHSKMVEPGFAENSDSLAFMMDTAGPDASPGDRLGSAVGTMRRIVATNFGGEALRWLDGRIEPVRSPRAHVEDWGAWFGSGFDHGGVMESLISYEWNPSLTDSLPAALYQISTTAVQLVPSLRPVLSTVRCGRTSGSQQMTFGIDAPLALMDLKPLMDALGLGKQHSSLMSAIGFALGARFTLPPDTAMLTLRPTKHGTEMRLDVDLDALPDTPTQFMQLIRMEMAERPTSLRALDRWLMALTPEGYSEAGHVSVLSAVVRPEMPARIRLYLRPASLDPDAAQPGAAQPGVAVAQVPVSAAPATGPAR